jgi:hypothetical protein
MDDQNEVGVDTQAVDQTAETSGIDQSPPAGETAGVDEKSPVPYSRFEEVVRANQEFRGTFTDQLQQIQQQLAQLGNQKAEPQPTGKQTWDDRAKTARSWDEFVGFIKEDVIQSFESKQREEAERAEKELDAEVKSLYEKKLIATKAEENEVIQFAIKKSEALGRAVPLAVAFAWLSETKAPATAANAKVAAKVQSSKKSQGGAGKEQADLSSVRRNSLDEIVAEAKENAPRE